MQRWLRRDEPIEGWWPWGLLPLIGLLLLLLFAWFYLSTAVIEEQVADSTRNRLARAGYAWAEVTADGQEVRVVGTSTTPVNEDVVAALAQSTECSTWLGQLACPTRVRVDIEYQPPPPPPARPHSFSFDLAQGTVTLSGEVPSEEDRRLLTDNARRAFGKIDDRLRVTDARPTADYTKARATAIELLRLLITGKATWSGGLFGASGVVKEGKKAEVDALLSSFDSDLRGPMNLLDEREASACDEDFAARLQTKIQFASASAEVRPESMGLLEALADIARRCPVTLQIEGHTDSTGTVEFNDRLSRNRAESVKAILEGMQIDSDQLVAVGYGQRRPIGDNQTERGKAQNRRIEIKVRR